ncbi:HlyD family type I secretion periplasmic adaptor subunit [Nitrospirillum sp. BR 11163]|uniref:HlyD family type I secretion periplasmic adaptor subunit n=1 Tax=Nitrospirillum sp. BR 11163 TaxID=3104323 RepID=UPI002AFFFC76|nr:HlyD family type I secretion periplasmic adaptor subunit [Nitrospirillum sp. BR 11163]MEA1675434.1 HlyD family type I secretion periplasmic adaptor subunit [Nitrospirillum sp. BR 11163]
MLADPSDTAPARSPLPPRPFLRPRSSAIGREFLPAALEVMETPPSPLGRAIGGTIMAFFTVAAVWACVGHIDIVASAPGRILPSGRVKVVQPMDSGIVTAIQVQDGDHVTTGQPLILLNTTTTAADRDRVTTDLIQARLDVARLTALRAGLDGTADGLTRAEKAFTPPVGVPAVTPDLVERTKAALRAQTQAQAAKLMALDQQIAQRAAEADEVRVTTAKLKASTELLAQQADIRRQLVEKEYGSKLVYLDVQQRLVEQQHDLAAQAQRAEEAIAAKRALEGQRAQAVSDFAHQTLEDLSMATQKEAEYAQDLIKAEQRLTQQTLTAPLTGTVQQLAVHTVGGVVSAAQSLMVIVPDDMPLMVEASVDNRDIGFIHRGQEVEMKIDTFTFTRYGLVHGHVLDLSRDAVTPDRDTPAANNTARAPGEDATMTADRQRSGATPIYVAHIALDRTALMVDGHEERLASGMAVTAEIKTGRRRIIDYILSPVSSHLHNGLHER